MGPTTLSCNILGDITNYPVVPTLDSPLDSTECAVVDTGSTGHYLPPNASCTNKQPIIDGPTVAVADGNTMTATHTANLPFPDMPDEAKRAFLFQGIHRSLMSVGQMADHNFISTFYKKYATLVHPLVTYVAYRDPKTGLYLMPMNATPYPTPPPVPTAALCLDPGKANIWEPQCLHAHKMQSQRDLVMYLHQAAYSPAVTTWCDAINANFYETWPGLTAKLVRKCLPPSLATAKGHLHQDRQNVRSTKPTLTPTSDATDSNLLETPNNPPNLLLSPEDETGVRAYQVYAKVVNYMAPTGKISTDQTGRFPVASSKGNRSIMVLYDYDSNAILTEPLKSHSAFELARATTKLYDYLTVRGLKPKIHWLDNECSQRVRDLMTARNVD